MIVLADLHGNLDALEAILAAAGPDRTVLCLGDVLGRAGEPDACVRRLSGRPRTLCVRGNHEVRARRDGGRVVPGSAPVSDDTLARLESWPRVRRRGGWTACHAAPDDVSVYLFEPGRIAAVMRTVSTPILFSAHTHRPMWFGGSSADALEERPVEPGVERSFDPARRHFLNPGSASQPLATDLPPTYLEVDLPDGGPAGTLRWHALPGVERARPGFG